MLRDAPPSRKLACVALSSILLLSFLGFVATFVPGATAQASGALTTGNWTETVDYAATSGSSGIGGVQIQGNSCLEYQGTIYCVGGLNLGSGSDTSASYYTYVLSSGAVGAWTETTDYGAISGSSGHGGLGVEWPSCAQYLGYIYCVGGEANGAPTSKVYYAQLNPNGIGNWAETTDYAAASGSSGGGGAPSGQLSCVADTGYIYCTGGNYPTAKTYFAPISSSGVGAWAETTDYGGTGTRGITGVSVSGASCADALGYIFCMGGQVQFSPVSEVFYAPLNGAGGIGAWTETTDYGAATGYTGSGGVDATGMSCSANGSSISCVGGQAQGSVNINDAFFAQDPPAIALSWVAGGAYPLASEWKSCTNSGTGVTCVGGGVSNVYYAPIAAASSTTSTTTAATSSTTTTTTTSTTSTSSSTTTTSTASTSTTATSTTSTSVPCAYTATANGNWNNLGIWSPAPVAPFPQSLPAGCTVTIPSGTTVSIPSGYVVTDNGTVQLNGNLDISGTLTVFGAVHNSGTIQNSGTVTNQGTIANSGSIDNSGTMNGQGSITGNAVVQEVSTTSAVPEFPGAALVLALISAIAVASLLARRARTGSACPSLTESLA